MQTEHTITVVEEIAAKTGLLPSTICQNALGNAHFYDRQKKRVVSNREAVEKLRAYAKSLKLQAEGSPA